MHKRSLNIKKETLENSIEVINHQKGIIEVRLNRPEKKNAISFDMMAELIVIAKKIRSQKHTRVVLLTGANNTFSSGVDLSNLSDKKNRFLLLWEFLRPGTNLFQKVNLVWRELPIPVIAVIEGHCIGAGLQLVLGADFRIATPDSKFSIMESKWGLVPDMGATVTLRGLVGTDKVKELAMTARIFSGEEAKNMGIITYAQENPLEKAMELANEIINYSPDAVAGVKKIFNAMVTKSESKSLYLEKIWQRKLVIGKNSKIAVKKDKNNEITFKDRQFD